MAIIRGIKRISPLDLNKNVTIGVAFPLDDKNLFSGTQTLQEQAKSNLINLLLTDKGERVNLPNFGVGLKNLLFEQNIDLFLLKEKIQTQTSRFIPNIVVTDVQTGLSNDEHTLYVKIVYRSTLDNQIDSVQLNFNE
tara:strand:+ start:250 stop:660 length:411 start_codon:yes stop_codon:yes gene_type:complete